MPQEVKATMSLKRPSRPPGSSWTSGRFAGRVEAIREVSVTEQPSQKVNRQRADYPPGRTGSELIPSLNQGTTCVALAVEACTDGRSSPAALTTIIRVLAAGHRRPQNAPCMTGVGAGNREPCRPRHKAPGGERGRAADGLARAAAPRAAAAGARWAGARVSLHRPYIRLDRRFRPRFALRYSFAFDLST